ncbi:MAG: hypothetical protein HYV26_14645 [Candidatus Hydrogenedentes bacterium]|nr:hypothetical protein [Candidatus Hydrogenedentota bacterium]
MKGRRGLAAVGVAAVILLGAALPVAAQGAEGESGPPATQVQLDELRQQIYELNKALRQIEVQVEEDKKAAEDKAKKTPIVAAGTDGFSLTSPDKAFQLRVGGRIAYDVAFFDQDRELKRAVGDEQDGIGFRYARLRLQGAVWDNVSFQFEIDFAGDTGADSPIFRDAYLQLDKVPYGIGDGASLRVGHFREPYSLEELTPIPYRTFNERSLGNVFVPGRNAGIQVSDAFFGEPKKERLTLTLGAFKVTDDLPSVNDSDEDQGYTLTGRVTGLPWYADDGRKLLHLGLAYSRRNPDGARMPYALRPETRLSMFRYVDVDAAPAGFRLIDARADDVNLLGAEAALVYGPFSIQGEYFLTDVDTTIGGDVQFSGWYAQATYFLTGEHRPYRHADGVFGRIVPNKSLGWKAKDGWGAWEVTTRYSSVNLEDGPIQAGTQDAVTLGLNWYLNPNARITWNYTYNTVDTWRYDGNFGVLQTRFQLEF